MEMTVASQSDYRFRLQLAEGPSFDVVRFVLTEGLSQPFRLSLELSCFQHDIELDVLLDGPATFTIARNGQPVREVHGIVTAFEQGDTGFRRTRYRAVIEPPLVRLGLRHNSRIFQRVAVPAILKTLLDEQHVPASSLEMLRGGEHVQREYCVQHREQDLAFFQRLAGEEGLVYFFDARAESRLVLTDALLAGPSLPGLDGALGTVAYQPSPGGDAAGPGLRRFAYRRQMASTRATRRDYSFKNPSYRFEHQARAVEGIGDYEHYDAPGRYKHDEAGKPFTRSRLSALRRDTTLAELEGDDARLWPGLAFALDGHPSSSLPRNWRVVGMRHEGEQSSGQEEDSVGAEQGSRYHCSGTAVPDNADWQPEPCPRPVMDGLQVAHVVGPPGEEIHTDEHGRVMVWFPWDREGPKENSSCWIRVSQGWAGASYGIMALPRIGHEVLVSFLDGDPDQPIVTGRSYHVTNRPPYELPNLKTLTTIKSQEHNGGGHNELLIDDTNGQIKAQLKSTHAATQLNLGFLTHPRGMDGSGTPRGEGFELRTDASGALRAARGLLITAYERAEAGSGQLDHAELVECVSTLASMAKTLADTAAQHQAAPMDHGPREALVKAVEQLGAGANDRQDQAGSEPIVALAAPEGIALATRKTVLVAARENVEVSAQDDHVQSAGGQLLVTAGKGISQFAVDGGLSHIAHRDDVRIQAQHGNVTVDAEQAIHQRGHRHVIVTAGEKALIECGKSALVLNPDGCIELFGTQLQVHAEVQILPPSSVQSSLPTFGEIDTAGQFVLRQADGERPAANRRYRISLEDGSVIEGITDAKGLTERLQKDALRIADIEVLHDDN